MIHIIYRNLRIMFFGAVIAILLATHPDRAIAQTPFLSSPYYSTTTVSQGYSTAHPAYDLALSYRQVTAAADGTTTRVQWFNNSLECHGPINNSACGYGLHVYIQHGNNYISRYAHLSSATFALNSSGATVRAGQIIGTSGNTGWSTGPHLHLEIKNASGGNTDPNNPNLWIDGQWATPSRPIPEPVNAGETQVDDATSSSGGFSKGNGGHFNNECNNNCGGWIRSNNMYYTLANGNAEDSWARWQPTLPVADAIYEIMVNIRNETAISTTWQAPYTIEHADGTSHAVIDQVGARGRWSSIGTYRMTSGQHSVYVTDASGETQGEHCSAGAYYSVGVDSVKFIRRGTAYAPDVRYNNSGWDSQVAVRNNGGGPASIIVKFHRSNGQNACDNYPDTLAAHEMRAYECFNTNVAAAVVEGNQDLGVLIINQANGLSHLDNAFVGGATADPAFEQTATTLYVPAIYNNIFGGINSTVHLQNAGNGQTTGTLTYTPRPGYICSPCSIHSEFARQQQYECYPYLL